MAANDYPEYSIGERLTPDDDSEIEHCVVQRLRSFDDNRIWYNVDVNGERIGSIPEDNYDDWQRAE